MNIKVVFAAISILLTIWSFIPYLEDVISKKTSPHKFTWLIWAITSGTAIAGLWYGGGGLGSAGLIIGAFFIILVFILSLRSDKTNITRSDIIILLAALSAIIVWWQLKNPLLAVLMASVIDVIGYIPTFRKSYNNPWSETVLSWGLFVFINIFAILALDNYNFLTLSYLVAISLASLSLFIFLLIRRIVIPKPVDFS